MPRIQSQAAKFAVPTLGTPSAQAAEAGALRLSPGGIARMMLKQSPAFWATFLYLFFEYVRPQSIYLWLDVAPWPKVFLFLAAALTVLEGRVRFAARSLWISVALFSAVIVASTATAQFPSYSWENKDFWINWLLLMLIVGGGVRSRTEFILHLIGFILWNLKMSQHGVQGWVSSGFSFVDWGATGGPGWFHNSGEFGIEMCVFLPIVGYFTFGVWDRLTLGQRLFLCAVVASALISIVASSSRGAFLGATCVAAWIVWRSPYRVRAIALVVPTIILTWMILPEGNKARWRAAGEDADSVRRLTYWKHGIEIAKDFPILGIGYRNWLPYYRAHYNPKGEVPHNYLVEAGSELGFTGLAVFVGMTIAYFRSNRQVRMRVSLQSETPDKFLWAMTFGLDGAMIGFLTSGFFVTVLFYPFYWMNMSLAMALARISIKRSSSRMPGAAVRHGIRSD